MAQVCFYFQIHQPFRLREYSFFNIGHDHAYQAVAQNYLLMEGIAARCYLPAARMLLNQIKIHKGKFKVTFSISGTALEQFELYCPEMIDLIRELLETNCVELLTETYYHSLAGLFDKQEFENQIGLHERMLLRLFDYVPTSFRNTELIFTDSIAEIISKMGYLSVLVESPLIGIGSDEDNCLFQAVSAEPLICLLRHTRLSDDIGFRFGNHDWMSNSFSANKYASWINDATDSDGYVGIYLDFETFGEHKNAQTGIFDFLENLPQELLLYENIKFVLPSELAKNKDLQPSKLRYYSTQLPISWATQNRDTSAWLESNMQKDAIKRIYALKDQMQLPENAQHSHTWGLLQTSDHFYYMSIKYWADPVHRSFSPYASPYDAYINYMNVLSDFEKCLFSQADTSESNS